MSAAPDTPRLARALLRLRSLGRRRPDVEADLFDVFTARVAAHGLPYARRRFYADVLSLWWHPLPIVRTSPKLRSNRAQPWRELGALLTGLRLALRRLVKSPGYTTATVATLALTIGATSAVFSAVYGVLLSPLPIRQPNDLVISWGSDLQHGANVVELSYRNFENWAARSRSFTESAAVGSSMWPAVLQMPNRAVRLWSAGVSVSFFDTLGVAPALGRGFRPEDDEPNAPRVLVLSHKAWLTHFGADPGIVGVTLRLAEPTTVVGVMPEGFDFPRGTDFWTPVVPILAESG
ncbi:MAG TPA: ABC transporter permease, partial [Vicinamibacterales bacterium]